MLLLLIFYTYIMGSSCCKQSIQSTQSGWFCETCHQSIPSDKRLCSQCQAKIDLQISPQDLMFMESFIQRVADKQSPRYAQVIHALGAYNRSRMRYPPQEPPSYGSIMSQASPFETLLMDEPLTPCEGSLLSPEYESTVEHEPIQYIKQSVICKYNLPSDKNSRVIEINGMEVSCIMAVCDEQLLICSSEKFKVYMKAKFNISDTSYHIHSAIVDDAFENGHLDDMVILRIYSMSYDGPMITYIRSLEIDGEPPKYIQLE